MKRFYLSTLYGFRSPDARLDELFRVGFADQPDIPHAPEAFGGKRFGADVVPHHLLTDAEQRCDFVNQ